MKIPLVIPQIVTWTLLAAVCRGQHDPRPAAEILRDYDRVSTPGFSDGADAESRRRFKEAIASAYTRRAELAAELQQGHSDHARLPELLAIRWAGMTNALHRPDDVLAELAPMLRDENLREDVRLEARRARARAHIVSTRSDNLERLDAVTDILDLPGDQAFAANCLMDLVWEHVSDPATQRDLYEVAVRKWPSNPYGGAPAKSWLKVLDRIGEPFVDLLPAASREWFASACERPTEFTVVQLWSGWVLEETTEELAALQQLRQRFGERLRLVGLLCGDFDARIEAARKAGVDWPQTEIRAAKPMSNPLGMPRFSGYAVLDRELRLIAIVGRAALVPEVIARKTEAKVQ